MGALALQVDELKIVKSNGIEIVAGVRLAVESSQILGLVGETGAGKTLTARAILGLLPRGLHATGRVRFVGQDWIRLDRPDQVARHLGRTAGLMLQNPRGAFDPIQRVGPQLVEAVVRNGLMSRTFAYERAAKLCDNLGLGRSKSVFRLYPHELSGGMIQRAALALTLMPGPRVLIVDEPTSALDASLRVDALRLLRSIARDDGSAMMLVSHDLGLVSHYCDILAVLYAGHLIEAGPTSTVLRYPAHPYTASLISCSLSLTRPHRGLLQTVGGEPPQPGSWPSGCYFHPRCPYAQERCRVERPVRKAIGSRSVACHFPRSEEHE